MTIVGDSRNQASLDEACEGMHHPRYFSGGRAIARVRPVINVSLVKSDIRNPTIVKIHY